MISDLSFQPKDGKTLRAVLICRVSTNKQDPRSVDDQETTLKQFVGSRFKGRTEYTAIKSTGQGERLDREELREVEALVDSGRFDLVVAEESGRIARRQWYFGAFVERCQDAGTRLIAINDNVDSANEDWELPASINSMSHEKANKHTANRIRRAFRARFPKGDLICPFPFGYVKPVGAKTIGEIQRDPAAEPIVEDIFRQVEAGISFAAIARGLKRACVPTGPSVRNKTWVAQLVGRFVRNPVLKGLLLWNRRVNKRKNLTGKRVAVKADPSELLEYWCPHLAFITPERFDRLQRMLGDRNGKYSRNKDGYDPRKNVPKKATYWPGGHTVCDKCGRSLYWGGHGKMDRLMCSGNKQRLCWNSCTFDGAFGAAAILRAILDEVAALPTFDDEVSDRLRRELDGQSADRRRRRGEIEGQIESLNRKTARLVDELAEAERGAPHIPGIRMKLAEYEAAKLRALDERVALDREPEVVPNLPSPEELLKRAKEALVNPPVTDPEFQLMMKALLPRLHLVPYRLCMDKKLVPRAHIVIDFLALSPDHKPLRGMLPSYQKVIVVDLFKPSQHVEFREQIMRLRAEGKTEREAADAVGISVTAAQRSALLQRKMDELGLADPWIELTRAPDDVGKMRSHKNEDYKFEPLPGFPPAV